MRLESISVVLLFALCFFYVVDWLQTIDIARHPDKWRERNPFLAELIKRGGSKGVDAWFTFWAFLGLALFATLASADQFGWLIGIECLAIVCEGYCVLNNYRLGIRS